MKEEGKAALGLLGFLVFAFVVASTKLLDYIADFIITAVKTVVFGTVGVAIVVTILITVIFTFFEIVDWIEKLGDKRKEKREKNK